MVAGDDLLMGDATLDRPASPVDPNVMLRQAVTLLAEDPSLESFLSHMLKAIAAAFGACEADLWRYDAATDGGSVRLSMEGGTIVGKEWGIHPALTPDLTNPRS